MKQALSFLIVYALLLNLTGFALMGFDKALARSGARRIRERTLFICAFLGGALGGLLGMYAFRHKTQKNAFRFGMPVLAVFEIAVYAAAVLLLK